MFNYIVKTILLVNKSNLISIIYWKVFDASFCPKRCVVLLEYIQYYQRIQPAQPTIIQNIYGHILSVGKFYYQFSTLIFLIFYYHYWLYFLTVELFKVLNLFSLQCRTSLYMYILKVNKYVLWCEKNLFWSGAP